MMSLAGFLYTLQSFFFLFLTLRQQEVVVATAHIINDADDAVDNFNFDMRPIMMEEDVQEDSSQFSLAISTGDGSREKEIFGRTTQQPDYSLLLIDDEKSLFQQQQPTTGQSNRHLLSITTITTEADFASITNGNKYIMGGNIDLEATISISVSFSLDGNGNTLAPLVRKRVFNLGLLGGETFILNNISFTNGYAGDAGGLISCNNGNLIIRSCTFTDSYIIHGSGGAIHVSSSGFRQLIIKDSYFEGCRANADTYGGTGGALYIVGDMGAVITGTTFANNYHAGLGGAISVSSSAGYLISIKRCRFINNYAGTFGGAIRGPTGSPLVVEDSDFIGNYLTGGAGQGGAAYSQRTDGVILEFLRCNFTDNHAAYGGAVSGATSIEDSTFDGNYATIYAGALQFTSIFSIDTPILSRSKFISNSAPYAGAIHVSASNLTILDSFFISNAADSYGGALVVVDNTVLHLYSPYFAGNSAGTVGADLSIDSTSSLVMYSACRPGEYGLGFGDALLDCDGCNSSYSSNYTGSCTACPGGLTSCCGAIGANSCAASVTCDGFNIPACPDPTLAPTSAPTEIPEFKTVYTESVLSNGLGVFGTMLLGADIYLTSVLSINAIDVVIDGLGVFKLDASSTTRHFTITGGTASAPCTLELRNITLTNGGSVPISSGGSISAAAYSSLIIVGCNFTNNKAALIGGAIYLTQSTLMVTDTSFYNNYCTSDGAGGTSQIFGGAVCMTTSSAAIFRRTSFVSSYAFNTGSAVYATLSSNHSYYFCSFYDNSAGSGGAVTSYATSPSLGPILVLEDCDFVGNSGALGGAVSNSYTSTAYITRCTFTNNSAAHSGGALYSPGKYLSVVDSIFTGNRAGSNDGGAISAHIGSIGLSISSTTFQGNSAGGDGGGVAMTGSVDNIAEFSNLLFIGNSARYGGAYTSKTVTSTFERSRFISNTATRGGAINVWFSSKVYTYGHYFLDNTATTTSGTNDVYHEVAAPFQSYSVCAAGYYDNGTIGDVSLDCSACVTALNYYSTDYRSISTCVQCSTGTTCCGATSSSSCTSTPTCTNEVCLESPTSFPTASFSPTLEPTMKRPSPLPTSSPTPKPTVKPTPLPTLPPTSSPTPTPTIKPTPLPTQAPTRTSEPPSQLPTSQPTLPPSSLPSPIPTLVPTSVPSIIPTPLPTLLPSIVPSPLPTLVPTLCEDTSPYCKLVTSFCDTAFCETCPQAHYCDVSCHFADCSLPTPLPSPVPTPAPSPVPTSSPTEVPTPTPTQVPTSSPSHLPTSVPSPEPTSEPTYEPTYSPTPVPTHTPTSLPTQLPTIFCEGNEAAIYLLTMYDSGGDGWDGVSLDVKDENTTLLYSTTLATGESLAKEWFCFTTGCYDIQLNITGMMNINSSDISWILEAQNGISVSGGAPYDNRICTDDYSFFNVPTFSPTISLLPSFSPTPAPSQLPTAQPTRVPTPSPTRSPTFPPTFYPTVTPTSAPTENCADGQYFNQGSCFDCEAGRYSVIADAVGRYPDSCKSCEIGFYSRTGSAECTACPEGKFSNGPRSDCVQCYSGQYVNTTLQGCYNCSAGKYTPTALNDLCLECGPGFSTGVDETASACDRCSAGTYSAGDGVINTCLECPAGSYSADRASECIGCEAGTYAATAGSPSCISCNAGKSTLGLQNATVCTNCVEGHYSNTRASICSKCRLGRYAHMPGLAACIECRAGSYTNETGTIRCALCANGTYQENSGQTSCVNCEIGKYAESSNSKECLKCADGHTSVTGSARCDRCDFDYYYAYSKQTKRWSCEQCPYGSDCQGDAFQPVAENGYWIDRTAAVKNPALLQYVYKCPRDTCVKVPFSVSTTPLASRRLSTATDCLILSNFSSAACGNDIQCRTGSLGPLCGSCEDKYIYNSQERMCKPCGSSTTWTQAFASLVIVMLGYALLWKLRKGYLFIPASLRSYTKGKSKLIIPYFGIWLGINRSSLKILLSTFQIISSVSWNLQVSFPEPYSSFAQWLSFVQLDFINLDCMEGSSYYQSVYAKSCVPIIIVGLSWCWYGVKYLNIKINEYGDRDMLRELLNQQVNLSLFFVFIFLPPVAGVQFRALNCVTLGDGSRYLRDDTNIDCSSESYKQFALINGCLIALYQSLPLLYIALLCRFRDRLNPVREEGETDAQVLERRDEDKSLDRFRFLFNEIKLNRWYFEVADLYRRVMFTGVLPLISKDSAIVAYVGSLMGLGSVVYFREQLPFRHEFNNFIAVVAQYVIFLVFLAALMLETDTRYLFNFSDLAFGLFMTGVNLLIIFLVVCGGYLRYKAAGGEANVIAQVEGYHIVMASKFDDYKFERECDILTRKVPSTHKLVYYYTSLEEAKTILRSDGIPALKLNPRLTSLTVYRPRVMQDGVDFAVGQRGGVIVSTKPPYLLTREEEDSLTFMNPSAVSKEAVLCLSIPHALLFSLEVQGDIVSVDTPVRVGTSLDSVLPGFLSNDNASENDGSSLLVSNPNKAITKRNASTTATTANNATVKHLRLLPVEFLELMQDVDLTPKKRRSSAGGKAILQRAISLNKLTTEDETPRSGLGLLMLSSDLILRTYQLTTSGSLSNILSDDQIVLQACEKPTVLVNEVINMNKAAVVSEVTDFKQYMITMAAARDACAELQLVPLYCYTSSKHFRREMLTKGLVLSSIDQTEVGLFFSTKSPCSLRLDTDSYESNLIEHIYGEKYLEKYLGKGAVDMVIVYGAEPRAIMKDENESSNRCMFARSINFRELLKSSTHYLRPDRIFGAMVIKQSMVLEPEEDKPKLAKEILLDNNMNKLFAQVELELKANSLSDSPFSMDTQTVVNDEADDWIFKSPVPVSKDKDGAGLLSVEAI